MPTAWSGVTLSWGNGVSIWTQTASTQQDGTAFKAGWNLVAFLWATAVTTGTPDSSNITYIEIDDNAPRSAMVGAKICNIVSALPQYLEMVYYSKYLFSKAGVWQEKIIDTDSADLATIINLDTESYVLYFSILCHYIAQQLQGADAQKDDQFFSGEYKESLKRYTAMYKSETLLPSEPYYQIPRQHNPVAPRWVS